MINNIYVKDKTKEQRDERKKHPICRSFLRARLILKH